jgi:hypothetical protein
VVVEPAVMSPDAVDLPAGLAPGAAPAFILEVGPATRAAHCSSPPGKSVLRI